MVIMVLLLAVLEYIRLHSTICNQMYMGQKRQRMAVFPEKEQ
jgi:hypothetical protein